MTRRFRNSLVISIFSAAALWLAVFAFAATPEAEKAPGKKKKAASTSEKKAAPAAEKAAPAAEKKAAPAAEKKAAPSEGSQGVKLTETDGKVRVEINGKLFTEYIYNEKGAYRPYLYPIIGPTGDSVVRDYPMKPGVKGVVDDHPHHRSLWFTHGDINGVNFWGNPPTPEEEKAAAEKSGKAEKKEGKEKAGEGKKAAGKKLIPGQVVQDKLLEATSGKDKGVIKVNDKYVTMDGKVILTDTRTMTFYNVPGAQMVDFDIVIHASNGDVTFNDTKEGSMAIRVASSMGLKGFKNNPVGAGSIVNSEGVRDVVSEAGKDNKTWGKRANWVDYYGPVNGKIVGIACFDHPSNTFHPTYWHVRDYGLFAANPFGVHDYEKKDDPTLGNLVIPAGKDAAFHWRWYFHTGDEKEGKVAEKYAEYEKVKY